MKICFASHNPGKLKRYIALTEEFGVELVPLTELGITEKVPEPFETSQENAMHKAKEYAKMVNMPVLACDEEMRTNFLPEKLQPGVLVRRLGQDLDRDPTDQEVIDHWLQLIKDHPHENQEFYWDFSVALYDPASGFEGAITVTQESEIADYVSENYNPGYPMSTFMSPKGTGRKPYLDTPQEVRTRVERGNYQPFLEIFPEWLKQIHG